jgi:glycylpeptide N-tetradecanoyltransferase
MKSFKIQFIWLCGSKTINKYNNNLSTDEKITCNEPIEPEKGTLEIRAEPYSLPVGFQWDTLNLDEPLVLKELYMLLNENYVEDDDSMFRFDYPPEFLKW